MKLLKKKNGKPVAKVDLGTLYDINKSIIENNVPVLTEEELEERKITIANFIKRQNNKYYMLLCNELKDYTLFNVQSGVEDEKTPEEILIEECIPNRGKVKSIDLTPTRDGIEI